MAANITQASYRFANDDGSETTATWRAALNTAIVFKPDTTFRLRFLITDPGTTSPSEALQLYYSKDAAAYVVVNASASNIRPASSANFTDGDATTTGARRLGSGTANSPFGFMDQVDALASTLTLTTAKECEVEFCLSVRSADIQCGHVLQFQCRNSSTVLTNYTNTAKLTVASAPATVSAAFVAKTPAITIKVSPATVAEVYAAKTSTRTVGPVLYPTTGVETFTAITEKWTLTLHPATVAEVFAAITSIVARVAKPATVAATFAAITDKLTLAVHPSTVVELYAAQTSIVKRILNPATVVAAFTTISDKWTLSIHPTAVSESFSAVTSIVGRVAKPAVVSATFTGVSSGVTIQLHPGTAIETYAAQTPIVHRGLSPSVFTESFAVYTSSWTLIEYPASIVFSFNAAAASLALTTHPNAIPEIYSAETSGLTSKLAASASSALFSNATSVLGFGEQPSTAAALFTAAIPMLTATLYPALRSEAFSPGLPVLSYTIRSSVVSEAFATFTSTVDVVAPGTFAPTPATEQYGQATSLIWATVRPETGSAVFSSSASVVVVAIDSDDAQWAYAGAGNTLSMRVATVARAAMFNGTSASLRLSIPASVATAVFATETSDAGQTVGQLIWLMPATGTLTYALFYSACGVRLPIWEPTVTVASMLPYGQMVPMPYDATAGVMAPSGDMVPIDYSGSMTEDGYSATCS